MFGSLISCPVAVGSYTLTGIICLFTKLVASSISILVALALLFFFWGLASWILNMGNAEKSKEGRTRMVWGLVALFFIVSIAGVVQVLSNTFFDNPVPVQEQDPFEGTIY